MSENIPLFVALCYLTWEFSPRTAFPYCLAQHWHSCHIYHQMNFYGPKAEEIPERKVFLKLQRSYKVSCWNQLPNWETSARGTTNQKPYKLNDIRKFFFGCVCVCVCVNISFSNFRGYLRTFSNDFTTRNSAIGAITCVRNLKRQSDNVTSI